LLPQSQFPVVEGKIYYIRASTLNYESISTSRVVPVWRDVDFKSELDSVFHPKDKCFFNTLLYFLWKPYMLNLRQKTAIEAEYPHLDESTKAANAAC